MGQRSWYTVPRAFMLEENHVMCPWAWRNWLSVGSTSSRFAVPPILPLHSWYNLPRASMFEDKRCEESLGLEPPLRAGSLYQLLPWQCRL